MILAIPRTSSLGPLRLLHLTGAVALTLAGAACDVDEMEVSSDKSGAYKVEPGGRGTKVLTASDGSTVTIQRDGTVTKPDGSKVQIKKDGTIVMPDGKQVRVFPDGSRSTLSVERTQFTADGSMVVVADDGSRTTIAPNGTVTRELPGGARSSMTIEKPTPPPAPGATPAPSKAASP
ncbi:hypothetical protein [Nannocystis punicea]|uniref:Uncharacterized protein n=1 Tax=Nannocystis punicea TaxID=2995304 RepID=A0ABY7GY59_9BACT|nr:hypothetical protein [Nannocystis poenicansa]WAS91764.1 hypothetical protein O0S08_36745 [Nannocystis poenicansa]